LSAIRNISFINNALIEFSSGSSSLCGKDNGFAIISLSHFDNAGQNYEVTPEAASGVTS
jgi:hypothetical protein